MKRDVNASRNILKEGLKIISSGTGDYTDGDSNPIVGGQFTNTSLLKTLENIGENLNIKTLKIGFVKHILPYVSRNYKKDVLQSFLDTLNFNQKDFYSYDYLRTKNEKFKIEQNDIKIKYFKGTIAYSFINIIKIIKLLKQNGLEKEISVHFKICELGFLRLFLYLNIEKFVGEKINLIQQFYVETLLNKEEKKLLNTKLKYLFITNNFNINDFLFNDENLLKTNNKVFIEKFIESFFNVNNFDIFEQKLKYMYFLGGTYKNISNYINNYVNKLNFLDEVRKTFGVHNEDNSKNILLDSSKKISFYTNKYHLKRYIFDFDDIVTSKINFLFLPSQVEYKIGNNKVFIDLEYVDNKLSCRHISISFDTNKNIGSPNISLIKHILPFIINYQ